MPTAQERRTYLENPDSSSEYTPMDSAGISTQGSLDASEWEAAAEMRAEHPRWVVIWVSYKHEYQARPLFRVPRRAEVVTSETPDELVRKMEKVEDSAASGR
jgi:hypothetical protein